MSRILPDDALTSASDIAEEMNVVEVGQSTIAMLQKIRDMLQATMSGKTKYRLGSMKGEPKTAAKPQGGESEVLKRLDELEAGNNYNPPGKMRQQGTPTRGKSSHRPDAVPPAPPPPPKKSPHHSVTLSLAKVRELNMLRELTPKNLAKRVQDVVRGCSMPGIEGLIFLGAQISSKTHIKVYMNSDAEANTLLETSEAWLPRLAPGASLVLKTWNMVVNSVPTSFRPDNWEDLDSIFERNPDILPAVVRKVCWLDTVSANKPGKRASSLVFTLSDYEAAERITIYGLFLESAVCPDTKPTHARLLIPPVLAAQATMTPKDARAHIHPNATPIGSAASPSSVLSAKEHTLLLTDPVPLGKQPSRKLVPNMTREISCRTQPATNAARRTPEHKKQPLNL
ncbi:hypothetical protein EV421DRAFT_1912331 [Armillaria borealis]|uniref:Uncharacterized protein n=1 Tax=Armillaria borealis TaxID=47425 RepID=A0AA39IUZ8_9AGAR|nr:hypothetical protein EV421DRAFT_1912331 [Armillaria borealis]